MEAEALILAEMTRYKCHVCGLGVCVAASINALTGNGLQFMYCNTYSAADSGAGSGDTIQEFARNSTASSSYIALYRTLTVGGGANPKGPLNNPFMGAFGGPI